MLNGLTGGCGHSYILTPDGANNFGVIDFQTWFSPAGIPSTGRKK